MPLHQKIFLLLIIFLPIQLGRHFWPKWSYVMGLRVDYLSPTIYLTDLLVFLILSLWGLKKLKTKTIFQYSKILFFCLPVFLFLLINCFLAKNYGAAFYKFLKILEFIFLGLYVAKNINVSYFIFRFLPISVVYSCLIALVQFIKQGSLGGLFWFLGERTFNRGTPGIAKIETVNRLLMRPYATFPHPNALAGFLLVSLILTLPFLIEKNKVFAIGYLLLVVGVLIITFSRSVWLVGLIFLILWILKRFKTTFWQIIFLGLTVLFSFYLIKFLNFSQESFSQRLKLAEISFQLIKKFPLSGVGLNNFVVYVPSFWKESILWLQPVHNIYLLVAAESGIVGLVVFFWFLFLTLSRLFTINYSLFFAITAILLLGLFDHYWLTLQQNQLLLAIILGLIWIKKKNTAFTLTNKN